ncbi:MAG: molybdopterin converting factor subunit 1 [Deltaproteobacteria bacterium]|nr:molybdopterin converting factor subunit 1 [Deltaproteobacteria bacterium]
MSVKLKLFAYLRETLGIKGEEIEIEEGTKVSQLWSLFKDKIPANKNFRILFAVNGEYVEEERELKEGDEVAFIPPVSGG